MYNMARQTSIECYRKIKDNGLLSKIRLKVMGRVLELAPCTATEVEAYMNVHDGMKGTWRVMTWLSEAGVVYETGTRACKISGHNCIEWDLTDRLPGKVAKKQMVKPRYINSSIDYIIAGMKIRGWDSIDIDTLKKLKRDAKAKKKN
jgi:hypothetical protein